MKPWKFISALLTLGTGFLVWFLYKMGHTSLNEPKWILKIREHPTAMGEYLALLARGLFHPDLLRTGATRQEASRPLPGDELVPKPIWQETRAITINAPSHEIWPWLVQMGGGRAGWYWWVPLAEHPKYKQFVITTDDILPQFQHLEVGDALSDGGPSVTEQRGNWTVMSLEPNRHLVLYAGRQMSEGGVDFDPQSQKKGQGLWFVCGWAFVLEPVGEGQTRLLVRIRTYGGPAWALPFLLLVGGKGDTVAENLMLRAIKERAEKRHAALQPVEERRVFA
jgi:hypothetical protein